MDPSRCAVLQAAHTHTHSSRSNRHAKSNPQPALAQALARAAGVEPLRRHTVSLCSSSGRHRRRFNAVVAEVMESSRRLFLSDVHLINGLAAALCHIRDVRPSPWGSEAWLPVIPTTAHV